MARVLLLEDNQDIGELLSLMLRQLDWEVVWVKGIEEADYVLSREADFEAAAFDYQVIGGTSENVVERFTKLYHCPTIAISNDPLFQEILTQAGCRYSCQKEDLPDFLNGLSGIVTSH